MRGPEWQLAQRETGGQLPGGDCFFFLSMAGVFVAILLYLSQ